ncbi:autotransporter outer membrane beta-barrel domain-containing protein [Bordetella sp. N]|uniref:autotransporter outer membrane beta-barrel domain-containing protein n=1 Tax=Bordetella sp. N TaxID=1746199 RepID=UPI00070A0879|nr:autotransporter outer membrane beta-barrel domain-containing protein [Bordetella sp. N]ALM81978.1 hypothetical protein ASB57_02445 [Bordetella sp. N]
MPKPARRPHCNGFRPTRLTLLLHAGACSLYLFGLPAHAQSGLPLSYLFIGDQGTCCSSGTDPDNGHDGKPGKRDFIQQDQDLHITANTAGQAGILINVSGGAGGNGSGAPSDDNHWGGNGGYGRNIDYGLSNSTIVSNARGIDLYSAGGNGGLWGNAAGPYGGYGIGGDGHLARVTVTDVTVSAVGFGIAAQSWGGAGSASAVKSGFGGRNDAGHGGNAGDATVILQGASSISVRGPGPDDVSAAVGLISAAGSGGMGIHTGDFGGHSNAGNGGNAGAVTFWSSAQSSVSSVGDGVYGILARSLGGNAAQNNPVEIVAGRGGNAGTVTVTNAGAITTSGNRAIAIYALSQGGNGGNGGGGSWSYAHDGGAGGAAGAITISNSGTIRSGSANTVGAKGIVASVLGGEGGAGGESGGFGRGGDGGTGGQAGQAISISNLGTISTQGNDAAAVLATSAGGGGGLAGSANGIIAVGGGHGGAAGNGGNIAVVNFGTITTTGDHSPGASLQSVGGGGGFGGDATATGVITAIAVGGKGGAAGDGAEVQLGNGGKITTAGASSTGVLLQSIGGGGGNAGSATAVGVGVGLNVTVATGGQGGSGGSGGLVVLSQARRATIATLGAQSNGVLAQSIGGGGGNGGMADSRSITIAPPTGDLPTGTVAVVVTHGGKGATAGNGGEIQISNDGSITTAGAQSSGVVAQSIGGGGGNGGAAIAPLKSPTIGASDFDVQFSLRQGAEGGAGGTGGTVQITNSATGVIATQGTGSTGIVAQSIGGGGGNGGIVQSHDAASFSDILGSPASLSGLLEKAATWLESGPEFTTNKTVNLTMGVTLGGSGGSGNQASAFTVRNDGRITTAGDHAPGILAQSIGGGGGNAGTIDSSSVSSLLGSLDALIQAATSAGQNVFSVGLPQFGATQQVGGSGGSGGDGGGTTAAPSTVINTGVIATQGTGSAGIVAQSVGAGGGRAVSSSQSLQDVLNAAAGNDAPAILDKITRIINLLGSKGVSALNSAVNLHVGGTDGASGMGGAVTVDAGASTSRISTQGDQAPGILAQSVGGGGGLAAVDYTQFLGSDVTASVTLGGTGDPGGLALGLNASNGGQVTVLNGGVIDTAGALSFGILAQSVGGGGGYVSVNRDGASATAASAITFGSGGRQTGAGGNVTVNQGASGAIHTTGIDSHGIVAQSIGGGGGIAGLATQPGLSTLAAATGTGSDGDIGNGGAVNLSIAGTVTTTGNGAIGLLAQSVGGGGGLTGDQAAASYSTGLIQSANLAGRIGNGGDLAITVANGGLIQTTGANAPAILAISAGGGAVFKDGTLYQYDLPADKAAKGGAINVHLEPNARVISTAANTPALVAVSNGTNGGGQDITITLDQNALLSANGDSGTAILTIAPLAATTIDNAGTIEGKTAVETAYQATINNTGTVAGDVLLPAGSSFNNDAGGQLYSGSRLRGNLNNAGVLNPGGPGNFMATRIQGSFNNTGTYSPDLDYTHHNSDFISVSGPATFSGSLTPVLHNPVKDIWLGIGHFDEAQDKIPTVASSSPLFDYQLKNNGGGGWRDPLVSVSANFVAPSLGLSADRMNIADSLQGLWDQGKVSDGPLFDKLTNVQNTQQYKDALNRIAHDGQFARAANQVHSSYTSMNRMMSCPTFVGENTILREGNCTWTRVDTNWTTRDGTSSDEAYRIRQTALTVGGQHEIAHNWFLGGTVNYAYGKTTASGVRAYSDTYAGGLALKYNNAPWQISMAVHAGVDNSRMSRDTLDGTARSKPDSTFVAGRLRAAYEFSQPAWYLRPYVDLDVNHVRQKRYQESGSDLFDLTVASNSSTSYMVSPMLELGGRKDLKGGATLRSYVAAGASFLSGGDVVTTMQLSNANAAPFSLRSGMPRTYGNLAAGLEYVTASKWELKTEVALRASGNYRDQALTLRAAYRF